MRRLIIKFFILLTILSFSSLSIAATGADFLKWDEDDLLHFVQSIQNKYPKTFNNFINESDGEVSEFLTHQEDLGRQLIKNSDYIKINKQRQPLLSISVTDPNEVPTTSETIIDPKFLESWGQEMAGLLQALAPQAKDLDAIKKLLQAKINSIVKKGDELISPQSLVTGMALTIETKQIRNQIFQSFGQKDYKRLIQLLKQHLPRDPYKHGLSAEKLSTSSALNKSQLIQLLTNTLSHNDDLNNLIALYSLTSISPANKTFNEFLLNLKESDLGQLKDQRSHPNIAKDIAAGLAHQPKNVGKLVAQRVGAIMKLVQGKTVKISKKIEPVVRLRLEEVHQMVGLLRGATGQDCSTSSSFVFPHSPYEKVFFIFNKRGEDVGYINGTIVEMRNNQKGFLINTIAGSHLSQDMANTVIDALQNERQNLGVDHILIINEGSQNRNLNYSPIKQTYNNYRGEAVQIEFADRWIRELLINWSDADIDYDDPDDLKNAHYTKKLDHKISTRVSKKAYKLDKVKQQPKEALLGLFVKNSDLAENIGIGFDLEFEDRNDEYVEYDDLDDLFANYNSLRTSVYERHLGRFFSENGLKRSRALPYVRELYAQGRLKAEDAFSKRNIKQTVEFIKIAGLGYVGNNIKKLMKIDSFVEYIRWLIQNADEGQLHYIAQLEFKPKLVLLFKNELMTSFNSLIKNKPDEDNVEYWNSKVAYFAGLLFQLEHVPDDALDRIFSYYADAQSDIQAEIENNYNEHKRGDDLNPKYLLIVALRSKNSYYEPRPFKSKAIRTMGMNLTEMRKLLTNSRQQTVAQYDKARLRFYKSLGIEDSTYVDGVLHEELSLGYLNAKDGFTSKKAGLAANELMKQIFSSNTNRQKNVAAIVKPKLNSIKKSPAFYRALMNEFSTNVSSGGINNLINTINLGLSSHIFDAEFSTWFNQLSNEELQNFIENSRITDILDLFNLLVDQKKFSGLALTIIDHLHFTSTANANKSKRFIRSLRNSKLMQNKDIVNSLYANTKNIKWLSTYFRSLRLSIRPKIENQNDLTFVLNGLLDNPSIDGLNEYIGLLKIICNKQQKTLSKTECIDQGLAQYISQPFGKLNIDQAKDTIEQLFKTNDYPQFTDAIFNAFYEADYNSLQGRYGRNFDRIFSLLTESNITPQNKEIFVRKVEQILKTDLVQLDDDDWSSDIEFEFADVLFRLSTLILMSEGSSSLYYGQKDLFYQIFFQEDGHDRANDFEESLKIHFENATESGEALARLIDVTYKFAFDSTREEKLIAFVVKIINRLYYHFKSTGESDFVEHLMKSLKLTGHEWNKFFAVLVNGASSNNASPTVNKGLVVLVLKNAYTMHPSVPDEFLSKVLKEESIELNELVSFLRVYKGALSVELVKQSIHYLIHNKFRKQDHPLVKQMLMLLPPEDRSKFVDLQLKELAKSNKEASADFYEFIREKEKSLKLNEKAVNSINKNADSDPSLRLRENESRLFALLKQPRISVHAIESEIQVADPLTVRKLVKSMPKLSNIKTKTSKERILQAAIANLAAADALNDVYPEILSIIYSFSAKDFINSELLLYLVENHSSIELYVSLFNLLDRTSYDFTDNWLIDGLLEELDKLSPSEGDHILKGLQWKGVGKHFYTKDEKGNVSNPKSSRFYRYIDFLLSHGYVATLRSFTYRFAAGKATDHFALSQPNRAYIIGAGLMLNDEKIVNYLFVDQETYYARPIAKVYADHRFTSYSNKNEALAKMRRLSGIKDTPKRFAAIKEELKNVPQLAPTRVNWDLVNYGCNEALGGN